LTVTVSKNELKQLLNKLDSLRLELLRLRATLLPEEEISEKEKKELEKARKQITKGSGINLDKLIKELKLTLNEKMYNHDCNNLDCITQTMIEATTALVDDTIEQLGINTHTINPPINIEEEVNVHAERTTTSEQKAARYYYQTQAGVNNT